MKVKLELTLAETLVVMTALLQYRMDETNNDADKQIARRVNGYLNDSTKAYFASKNEQMYYDVIKNMEDLAK